MYFFILVFFHFVLYFFVVHIFLVFLYLSIWRLNPDIPAHYLSRAGSLRSHRGHHFPGQQYFYYNSYSNNNNQNHFHGELFYYHQFSPILQLQLHNHNHNHDHPTMDTILLVIIIHFPFIIDHRWSLWWHNHHNYHDYQFCWWLSFTCHLSSIIIDHYDGTNHHYDHPTVVTVSLVIVFDLPFITINHHFVGNCHYHQSS